MHVNREFFVCLSTSSASDVANLQRSAHDTQGQSAQACRPTHDAADGLEFGNAGNSVGDEHETCKIPDGPSLAHGPSRRQPQFFGDGWGRLVKAEVVMTETVNMPYFVRREPCNDLWRHRIPLIDQGL